MIIKEYRIPLPLSVEEYRVAQLYMIAKSSRLETEDQSSGVEIIQNKPYVDKETGQVGQYTIKNYYVAARLPTYLKVLVENTVNFYVKEEAWNTYPYTKTIYSLPSSNKLLVEIDTYYFDDPGLKEDVFNLDANEAKLKTVDFIDIVKDKINGKDYKKNEDPLFFKSEKTGRGPLNENWLEEYRKDYLKSVENGTKLQKNIMCAYKLVKIQTNFWAFNTRLEKFIDEIALRKTMVKAHKQAWAWQDECFELKMEDIREYEKETQRILSLKMNRNKRSSRSSICADELFSTNKKIPNRRSSSINNSGNNNFNIDAWRIDKMNESGDSNDEYFDVKEEFDKNSLCKYSSLECLNKLDGETLSNEDLTKLSISKTPTSLSKESLALSTIDKKQKLCSKLELIFILHGGHLLENDNEFNNKYADFSILKSTFEQIIRTSYSNLNNKLEFRLICCPLICKSSLQFLSKLSTTFQQNSRFTDYSENLPIDCLPLFATNLPDYQNQINKTINSINQSFKEFTESEEGKFFVEGGGRISFICDFLGGILAYDSLCNRQSNSNENLKYDFKVDDIFLLGCPISLILAFRKLTTNALIEKPNCSQVYNLYHPMNRLAMRIEPLIESKFIEISPIKVPKYNKQVLMHQIISIKKHLKYNQNILNNNQENEETSEENSNLQNIMQKWWGDNRIDYELYCPRGINNFPNNALPFLFHANFWESCDVASFILDKLMLEVDPEHYFCKGQKLEDQLIDKPKEKWLKKSTSFKIKKIHSNHRANDIIVKEDDEQVLVARFMYGPLDVVTLAGEKIDIYLMKDMNKDDWIFLGTEVTDKNGRINHTVQDRLDCGIYPVKMIVRGDHSSIDLFLAVLPPQTECVVFSIDGSFAASVSVTGKDPKVRPGAVDVVRFWQEMGFLIIYITARPDMQQQKVISWLNEHRFPFGLTYFTGGLTTDPLKHKASYLEKLQNEVELSIFAAYGSAKDIWIYQTLGLSKDNIFIAGKVNKKQQHLANIITDGYASHLKELKLPGFCRPALLNSKFELPRGDFGLCGNFGFCGIRLRKNKAIRTISYPLSNQTTPKLSNKKYSNLNLLTISSNSSTLNSFKSLNYSTTSGLFTNLFHNRTCSNKSK